MISTYTLARLCGVSQGTVARALSNSGRIAEATKARILTAAEKHGYVANPAVRETIDGRSHVVGAVIPEAAGSSLMAVLREVTVALRARGLSLFIAQADDQEGYDALIKEFAGRRVKSSSSKTRSRWITRGLSR